MSERGTFGQALSVSIFWAESRKSCNSNCKSFLFERGGGEEVMSPRMLKVENERNI